MSQDPLTSRTFRAARHQTAAAVAERSGRMSPPEPDRGYLSEIFSSIQGEGMHVGTRHVFVRTAGCKATCQWCDTIPSLFQPARCAVHDRRKRTVVNPVPVGDVVALVVDVAGDDPAARTVSITGGEPLEQPEFVRNLALALRAAGFAVYLETNGLEAAAFAGVVDAIDVVAMDIKLPSALGQPAWEAHRAFLDAVAGTRFDPSATGWRPADFFTKIVVAPGTTVDEVEEAARMVADVHREIPMVLQPESETLLSARTPAVAAAALLQNVSACQRAAAGFLADVRVIPQCHKLIGVR